MCNNGVCVQPHYCNNSYRNCIGGKCVECYLDDDCPGSKYCSNYGHKCVECFSDSHCFTNEECGYYCHGNTCKKDSNI